MVLDDYLRSMIGRLRKRHILLVFLLLVLPGIFAPYHADDYFHLLLLQNDTSLQRGGDGSLWGLFSFIDQLPEHRRQMQQYGVLPWFAADDFYFRFWRPLAEISHWLDYLLFGLSALPAHMHSVVWFVLLAMLVWCLARQTLPEKSLLPVLVLAIFAWDGQHVATIGWIANRNALLAAVFAMAALYLHICWRETGRQRYLVMALPALLMALLSGEAALALGSYLFCYAWFMDGAGKKTALIALLPYAVVVLAWFYVYQLLGFGANTSAGLYINPLREPLAYISALLWRLPVYVTAGILPVPAGLAWIGGAEHAWAGHVFTVFAGFFCLLLLIGFRRFFSADKLLCFWFFSSLGALLPVCSTLAQDRLALFQTIGLDMVLAIMIYRCLWQAGCPLRQGRLYIGRVLVLVHLLLSPLHLAAGSAYLYWGANRILANAASFEESDLQGKKLLVMQVPIGEAVSLLGICEVMGLARPDHFLWLSSNEGRLKLSVLNAREWLLEKPLGFANGFESAFRSVKYRPFFEGEIIAGSIADIQILHINRQRFPDRIKVRFHHAVDANDMVLYTFADGAYRKLPLPEPGQVLQF